MQKLLITFGGLLWALICFRLALSVHFPTEALTDRINYSAQNSGYDVQMSEFGPKGIVGIGATDISISNLNSNKETTVPLLKFDALSVSINPILLLGKKISAGIDADLFDGNISMDYQRSMDSGKTWELQSNISNINLAQIPIQGDAWSINALGSLNWETDIEMNTAKIKQSTGSGRLTIENFGIDGGSIAGVEIMELSFNQTEIVYTLDKGKIEIDSGTIEGDKLSVDISGSIQLKKRLENSRLMLEFIFTFSDDLKMMARFIPGIEEMDDDRYKLKLNGTFKSPSTSNSTRSRSTKTESRSTGRDSRISEGGSAKSRSASDARSGRSSDDLEKRREDRARRLEERRSARQERLEEQRMGAEMGAVGGRNRTPINRGEVYNDDLPTPPELPEFEDELMEDEDLEELIDMEEEEFDEDMEEIIEPSDEEEYED
jgi:type II secretion system protein N